MFSNDGAGEGRALLVERGYFLEEVPNLLFLV